MAKQHVGMKTIKYSAINACAKGAQWEDALGPQAAMAHETVEVHINTYNSANSAVAKDAQWKTVHGFLAAMAKQNVDTDTITFNSAIHTCTGAGEAGSHQCMCKTCPTGDSDAQQDVKTHALLGILQWQEDLSEGPLSIELAC